eukprot:260855-Amphidinium_carterae.1
MANHSSCCSVWPRSLAPREEFVKRIVDVPKIDSIGNAETQRHKLWRTDDVPKGLALSPAHGVPR